MNTIKCREPISINAFKYRYSIQTGISCSLPVLGITTILTLLRQFPREALVFASATVPSSLRTTLSFPQATTVLPADAKTAATSEAV